MTVKERLIDYIKFKGISVNRFEKTCRLSTGYVGNMRVSIQPDKLTNIAHNYPDLNTGWLMTGEGEMLKKIVATSTNEDKNQDVISMPADVWAVISNQAKSLEVKDRQTSEAMKQTSEVIELLKEQLKKGRDAEKTLRAANLVVVEDE